MPLLSIKTSVGVKFDHNHILRQASKNLAELTGKPESYVMTILEADQQMTFAGSDEPCCFIEVKSIGNLSPKIISAKLCELISRETSINPNRIYIHFEDVIPSNWGFNSSTFG